MGGQIGGNPSRAEAAALAGAGVREPLRGDPPEAVASTDEPIELESTYTSKVLMKAMVLPKVHDLKKERAPLSFEEVPEPEAVEKELLVKVSVCGVCRTDLDEIEGRTLPARFPVILGHQIVGRVERLGKGASKFRLGDRVGIAWIHSSCGECSFCKTGQENLCDRFQATGRDANGGYAELTTVGEDFAYPIPEVFSDVEAAPLLCAGAVGYRGLRLARTNDGQRLGFMGFGGSAHLVLMAAKHACPDSKLYAFSRSAGERAFALELGATWAGAIEQNPPVKLDAIIDTTPVWKAIVESLKNLEKGGRLVVNAISKEEGDKDSLLRLDFQKHLWLEKEIKSVANITRRDVREFLALAAGVPIKPTVQEFRLEDANKALLELREGRIRGTKVLRIN
jgi:alcohol dehydrogenase, propanol-preferring